MCCKSSVKSSKLIYMTTQCHSVWCGEGEGSYWESEAWYWATISSLVASTTVMCSGCSTPDSFSMATTVPATHTPHTQR